MEYAVNYVPSELTLKEFKLIKGICTKCGFPISMNASHGLIRNHIINDKKRGNAYLIDMPSFMFSNKVLLSHKMHVLLHYNPFEQNKDWYIQSLAMIQHNMKRNLVIHQKNLHVNMLVGGDSDSRRATHYHSAYLSAIECYYRLSSNISFLKTNFSDERMFHNIYNVLGGTINTYISCDEELTIRFKPKTEGEKTQETRRSYWASGVWEWERRGRAYACADSKFAGDIIVSNLDSLHSIFCDELR